MSDSQVQQNTNSGVGSGGSSTGIIIGIVIIVAAIAAFGIYYYVHHHSGNTVPVDTAIYLFPTSDTDCSTYPSGALLIRTDKCEKYSIYNGSSYDEETYFAFDSKGAIQAYSDSGCTTLIASSDTNGANATAAAKDMVSFVSNVGKCTKLQDDLFIDNSTDYGYSYTTLPSSNSLVAVYTDSSCTVPDTSVDDFLFPIVPGTCTGDSTVLGNSAFAKYAINTTDSTKIDTQLYSDSDCSTTSGSVVTLANTCFLLTTGKYGKVVTF